MKRQLSGELQSTNAIGSLLSIRNRQSKNDIPGLLVDIYNNQFRVNEAPSHSDNGKKTCLDNIFDKNHNTNDDSTLGTSSSIIDNQIISFNPSMGYVNNNLNNNLNNNASNCSFQIGCHVLARRVQFTLPYKML